MLSWMEPGSRAIPRELTIAGAVFAAAVAAWILTYRRMRGMDMGPGTDLGGLAWYVSVWVVMTAAMMLPSLLPATLTFGALAEKSPRPAATAFFVGGYLLAWTGFGLLAYGVYLAAASAVPDFLAWRDGGRFVAAGALVLAGLYELTPFKHACLRRCRGSLSLVGRWRDGVPGAVSMGVRHGLDCVGCCWGLMLALFALGVMSLTWMATIAVAIAAEKLMPRGERLVPFIGALAVAAGVWVAVSPGSLPGLHVPH